MSDPSQPTQPLTEDELESYRQGFSGPYDGHVIRLLAEVDRLRAELAAAANTIATPAKQLAEIGAIVGYPDPPLIAATVRAELSRLRAENTAQAASINAVLELHHPVNHRGVRVCNACTPLDVLMQTMSGRGRRGVEHPCATARALGLDQDGGES